MPSVSNLVFIGTDFHRYSVKGLIFIDKDYKYSIAL